MTQAQLAAAAGIAQSTVCKIEKNMAHLRLDHAARFSVVLHCNLEDLLGYGPDGPSYTIVFNPPPRLQPGL